MTLFKKLFIHSPIHYGIGAGATILYILINMIFDNFIILYLPDTIMTAGLLLSLVGLLILCIYYGAFDTFGYSFTLLKKREKRKYRDLVDYTNQKTNSRKQKEIFFMPYIVIGITVLLIGFVTSLFIKPLPKLESPTNINVVEVDGKLEISWKKNDNAINGYVLYYARHVDNENIEVLPEATYIEVEQQNADIIKVIIEDIDLTQSYDIAISCKSVEEKFSPSDYSEEVIYKPNN